MLLGYQNWSTGKVVYTTIDIRHAPVMYTPVTLDREGNVLANEWLPGAHWLVEECVRG